MTFGEKLRSLPKSLILLVAAVVVAGIGSLDASTRWEISFFVFYTAPIFLVAWTCPKKIVFAFTLLVAVTSWSVNVDKAPSLSIHAWRSLNRLLSFAFVATAGIALRTQQEHFRARLVALEHSRELEHEIIRVSEREQRRIGQDLHDGICQNLAALDCAAGMLKTKLTARAIDEATTAEEIQHLLRKTLLETRSLARGIFPVQLEQDGLAVALEELAATASRMQGIPVSVELDGDIAIKDPEVSMHLYRIAQEALSNALRHAHPSTVTIGLRQNARHLTLAICDDGTGFNGAESKGMGLRTIRYRTKSIGGDLTIAPSSPKGTLVQCSIPLSHHDSHPS